MIDDKVLAESTRIPTGMPDPATLAQLEKLVPGTAERVIHQCLDMQQREMALRERVVASVSDEQAMKHAELDEFRRQAEHQRIMERRLMWPGIGLALAVVGVSSYLVIIGSYTAASVTFLTVLGGGTVLGFFLKRQDEAARPADPNSK